MHPLCRRAALRVAAFLASGAVVFAACGGSKPKTPTATPSAGPGTPGVTSTPLPSATPTPPSPDLKAARRLQDEGEYAAAADVYGAIAASTDAEKQQQAQLAQAQLLVKLARPADARPVLDAYLAAGAGGSGDASPARYMLASTLDDLGDMPGALASYERYIAANGPIAGFARVERAKLLARLGRSADAEAAGQAVLAGMLLPEFKASFTLSMGRALEQGADDAGAKAWYARAETIAGGDIASALARIGAIDKRLGDPAWVDLYLQAIAAYPSSGVAPDLLDELDAAAVPVAPYTRGVVEYRAFRNAAARTTLQRAIAAGDNAAEATYYLGALDERASDPAAAIDDYAASYDLDPASTLADDALWWRARLLERAGRLDEAGAVYAALVATFPASTWRSDAEFRRGLVQFKAKNYGGAALSWSVIASSPAGDDAFRARFWQGRALKAANDPLADAVLTQLVDDHDAAGNFYALRAEVLLGKNVTKESTPKLTDFASEKLDWKKIADYVKNITGADPRPSLPRISSDERFGEAATLEDVGLHSQSDAIYRTIIRENRDDLMALYQLAFNFSAENRTPQAARAAITLIAALPDTAATPPDDLERVAYPAAYGALVTAAAKNEDVSPLLLLSLVRQESFFDAEAGSGAGALGLTQVVPATGEQIARQLGVTDFVAGDLFRPKISLRFGASYLKTQIDASGGNIYRAFAAYNGGPGATSDAEKISGADDDLFVEELEFDETQRYVRIVSENLARYRQLYAKVPRPSLPE